MNNLSKILHILLIITLITSCTEDSESSQEIEPNLVPELKLKQQQTTRKTHEEILQVQLPQSIEISLPLNIQPQASDTIAIITAPTKGALTINGNALTYIPIGQVGEDSFIISITENLTTVEHVFELYIFNSKPSSGSAPHILMSDPVYGLYNELADGISVWGFNLEDPSTDITVELCNLSEECVTTLNLDYRQNTLESLPSLLQGLNDQEKIQELNFSIPEAAHGEYFIRVSNQFGESTLPFTVRPKTFEITFDKTSYEVQFDQDFSIPLTISLDDGHSVNSSISIAPLFGKANIVDDTLSYTPSGTLGKDSLTLLITDGEKTVEQKIDIIISDFSPHLTLSTPTYGLPGELESGITIWGYNLGKQQDDTKLELCDVSQGCIDILAINHWRNAVDNIPHALESLSGSQTIQEINFSLPDTSTGEKTIRVSNEFGSNSLPFNVESLTFQSNFEKTTFNVQFDKYVTIPLNITADEGVVISTSLDVSPALGEAVIIDNTLTYMPAGSFGEDRLTISISDNKKTIEQEFIFNVADYSPHLAFSDITSGPSTGLADGKGSGAIVTVWGYKLGEEQGESTIEYCDSNNFCSNAAYIYYWKNADGTLPGGPANLFESHGMQEVSFSIPNNDNGIGTIKLTTEFGSTTLPFTIRDGNIYHVATDGNNTNNCSFSSPCAYINGDINGGSQGGLANGKLSAGDIVYSHGVQEPTFTGGGIEAGMFMRSISGTELAPVSIIAYPDPDNFSTITSAHRGINNYLSEGIVTSKYVIAVGYAAPDLPINAGNPAASNFHISASRNGRGIGNLLIQKPNTCFTGWSGAIVSGGHGGQNFKALGNHIKELGCDNSSRYAHTLYMSIRSEASVITKPWEIGYNYLDNNNVFYGIHNYDETYTGDCGTMTGILKIHNNVIINQRGAGINIGTRDASNPKIACWAVDIEIYNNVLINVGLGTLQEDGVANAAAIQVGGDLSGSSLNISNNTIYGHGDEVSLTAASNKMISIRYNWSDPIVEMNNNIFVQTYDLPWFITTETITGSHNIFWSTATNSANSPYSLENNIIADPDININDSKITLDDNYPLESYNFMVTPLSTHDIYGNKLSNTIGAIQKE